MVRLETLIAISMFLFTTSAVHAVAPPAFEKWLGPQTNKDAKMFSPVVGKPIDAAKHDTLPLYDITLEIAKGGDIKLPISENEIITFDGKEFTILKEFHPDEDATYLFCQLQLKRDKLGLRFYTLNARITDGNLKGAIVHFRGNRFQKSISDPCVAIYRIPEGLNVEFGKAPYEIVALFAK